LNSPRTYNRPPPLSPASRQQKRARERREAKVQDSLDRINESHARQQARLVRQLSRHHGYEEDML
jgi:hypothetical protein